MVEPYNHEIVADDSFSKEPIIWDREMNESESGQMVLDKVKWTYFDAYLWQKCEIMQNKIIDWIHNWRIDGFGRI